MASLHGKPRLPKHFSLISAQTSDQHDDKKHEELRGKLRDGGYDPVEVQTNHAGADEKSFMVEHDGTPDDRKAMEGMAKEHGQESVLHSSRLAGPDGHGHHNELRMVQTGKSVPGRGYRHGAGITSHYTTLPDGSRFQMGVGNLEKEVVNEPLAKPVRKSEAGEALREASVREKLERLRSLVKRESIPAADLRISDPESQCAACEQPAADCACYEGLSRPTISVAGGSVEVMFKSDWTPEDKDNFVDDLKRRAGIVLKGKIGVLRQAKRAVDRRRGRA
jgi:hypothetical protein